MSTVSRIFHLWRFAFLSVWLDLILYWLGLVVYVVLAMQSPERQKDFVQAIFESHAAGRIDLQVAVQLALICRFYERIGDHAVNIGERVRYIVTGALPEHPSVSSESGSST